MKNNVSASIRICEALQVFKVRSHGRKRTEPLSPERARLEAVMLLSVLALDPPSAALLPSSKAEPCIARFLMTHG